MFLLKPRSHGNYKCGNSKGSWYTGCPEVSNINFMCISKILKVSCFLNVLGFEGRASPLYFPPFYCLQSPFPAASMRQFYCRAQRWSEPRREVAAARQRGVDEEGVKCLCMCRDEARKVWDKGEKTWESVTAVNKYQAVWGWVCLRAKWGTKRTTYWLIFFFCV